ncbi:MAG: BatA domain-containing protein [Planctomycetota bacterium]
MIEGFVHPALAAGAALAAVPVIIHLLNRQRHRPVPWAAMRFVLAAYRRTRRRVQLENLLLLLLRALAIAALALAIARPFATGGGPLTALREARRDLVLVVDGSASTGYRDGLSTVFDRIRERATALVDELDGARGDRVQIVFAGAWPRLSSWSTPEEARVLLTTLTTPTDEPLALAAALAEVAALVADGGGALGTRALDVRLLTDLQRQSFETLRVAGPRDAAAPGQSAPANAASSSDAAAGGAGVPELIRQLDALRAADVTVLVEDLGPSAERPANLSVAALEPLGEVPPAGAAFELAVSVANFGPDVKLGERVWLEVDGERLPSQRIDVPAGGRAEAVFTLKIEQPGHHALFGGISGDALTVDDTRPAVVFVPPPLAVLVANGAPAERIDDDEVGLLMTVLEPPDEGAGFAPGLSSAAPFAPTEISAATLGAETSGIETADVIVLANVPPLTESVRARIAARVEAGAALLITAGDRMGDLALWSEGLYAPDGTGLLPVEPLRRVAAARRESYYRVASFEETHPALAFFAEERWRPLLTEVPFYEFIAARPAPGAAVLARLDDTSSSPLLTEHAFGAGRVAFWASTISKSWNLVPQSPGTFVPLVHELLRHLGRRPMATRSVEPGTPVNLVADRFLRGAELVRPDGLTRALSGDANERSDGRWSLPEIPGSDTERTGLYEVRAVGEAPERFAVQLAVRESDLVRTTAREVEALHPALRVRSGVEKDSPTRRADGPGGEIWRVIAALALAFLVLESLWGAWVGQRRKQVSA